MSWNRLSILFYAAAAAVLVVGLSSYVHRNLAPPDSSEPTRINATLVRVIDGDTIAVEVTEQLPGNDDRHHEEHVVRLLGIDAPEMNFSSGEPAECGAQEALELLERMLEPGSSLTLIFDANSDRTDRYERSLAYVHSEGPKQVDVAQELIEAGRVTAWYPNRSEPEPQRFEHYRTSSLSAKAGDVGLWADCDDLGRSLN